MANLDRVQQLHRLLKTRRRPVALAALANELECSERTVRRLIDDMRLWFDAPIEYDKTANGWHYAKGAEFDLPGFWLTANELQSLALLVHVLEGFGNGLLNDQLTGMARQIDQLLEARGIDAGVFADRIRVLPLADRSVPGGVFQQVGEALLTQRQLAIRYRSFTGKYSQRQISPQTLVHYRENWCLDAWCHLRAELRTFSLARIVGCELTGKPARKINRQTLQAHFAASYGIFAGAARHTARLRFASTIAHEISQQQWHPEQQGVWEGDGRAPLSSDSGAGRLSSSSS